MTDKDYKRQIKHLKEENELLKNIILEFDKRAKSLLCFLKITDTEKQQQQSRAEILQSKFNDTIKENEL